MDFVLFLETFVQFDRNTSWGRAPVVAQPFSLRILATARDCPMQASRLVKRPALLGYPVLEQYEYHQFTTGFALLADISSHGTYPRVSVFVGSAHGWPLFEQSSLGQDR